MIEIDFDELEEELDLIVPNVYRMFIDAVNFNKLNLQQHGIYHTTQAILKGNWKLRLNLADADPKWENDYLDFGVGDGCGNYFFLLARDEEDDLVQLWAHDPPSIENVSTGTVFFKSLLTELEAGFKGPNQYRYQGNGTCD